MPGQSHHELSSSPLPATLPRSHSAMIFRTSNLRTGCLANVLEADMSKLIQPKQSRSLEERYEMLRKTLAHYLLLQVGTFVAASGIDAIGPAMDILTNMKAELKVQDIKAKSNGSRVEDRKSTR